MTFFFNAAEGGEIGRQQWPGGRARARRALLLDAAADVPPIANLWNYTKMGYDLVAFSGGKGMRGPQNAGTLAGQKGSDEAVAANNNPNDRSVGRGMKVAKEQIVGMVAAVDWSLSLSDEQIERDARQRADVIAKALKDLPTVTTEILIPPIANPRVPHLMIRYDQQRIAITLPDGSGAAERHAVNRGIIRERGSHVGCGGSHIGREYDRHRPVDDEAGRGRHRRAAAAGCFARRSFLTSVSGHSAATPEREVEGRK